MDFKYKGISEDKINEIQVKYMPKFEIPLLDIGGEYEFTAEIQPPERMTVRDINLVLFGFDAEKLKQNNWRKMHGMVMHRRLKRK